MKNRQFLICIFGPSNMAKVVVGLSGGVDSSVAAYLLQEQGHEVIGMFMKNWHDTSVTISDECPWIDDSNDAIMVAESLGIPFQTIDLSEEYKKRIVDYMFAEYEAGRTPNPDVLCNREIKFDVFLNAAVQLGADYVATGHYCRKEEIDTAEGKVYRLLAGIDGNKDQSYFLCQVTQKQLAKALFPIGHLTKPEVREIAAKMGLATATKKDSQGLCFIGKVRLPEFLQQQLKPKKGNIIEIAADSSLYSNIEAPRYSSVDEDLHAFTRAIKYQETDGKKVGEHSGAHYFTIGQRKGLNVGGKAEGMFVIATDTITNTIYVGMGDQHPGLLRNGLFVPQADAHWIREDLKLKIGTEKDFLLRIRYRQALANGRLYQREEGIYILFENPTKAIAAGQFAAWYLADELMGSGVIS
jgi:tRNA-specific 2-thiouridylase